MGMASGLRARLRLAVKRANVSNLTESRITPRSILTFTAFRHEPRVRSVTQSLFALPNRPAHTPFRSGSR